MPRKAYIAIKCILMCCLTSTLLCMFFLHHPSSKEILNKTEPELVTYVTSVKEILNKTEPELVTYVTERKIYLVRDEIANNSQRTLSCGTGTDTKKRNSIWSLAEMKPLKFLSNYKNPCYLLNVTSSRHTTQRLRCLPYYFIVGFPKSGTTDMWSRLMDHPDIPGNHKKEPNFYRKEMLVSDFNNAVETYASHFERTAVDLNKLVAPSSSAGQGQGTISYHQGIIGDGTADAAYDNPRWQDFPGNENCVEPRITNADYFHKLLPNLKVIFLVRNPVERLYSDYIYEARWKHYPISSSNFHSSVLDVIHRHEQCQRDYPIRACAYNNTIDPFKLRLRIGMYHIFIKDWLKLFPREQILVIKTEDMENAGKNSKVYEQLFKFLEIRPFTSKEEARVLNKQKSNTRNVKEKSIGDMWSSTRTLIENFYRSHNRQLAELLGDDRFLWKQ